MHNLLLANTCQSIPGDIVECGTWKGGMIAGFAEVLGNSHHYHLFDSFEGLPGVQPIDGTAALSWQTDTEFPNYFNNCTANQSEAQEAMQKSGVSNIHIHKGWFQDTLPTFVPLQNGIALLHLDGDWYKSTMVCLENLFPFVLPNGIIIIDDYYTWEGCSKAVHVYLARHQLAARIHQFLNDICYLRKD